MQFYQRIKLPHRLTRSSERSDSWKSWWEWRELHRNASWICSAKTQYEHNIRSPDSNTDH